MQAIEIVAKHAEPVRFAETTGVAAGYGHDNIGPIFRDRLPIVWRYVVEGALTRRLALPCPGGHRRTAPARRVDGDRQPA